MPLTEEDYESLRAQADADPERFRDWDPEGTFRKDYATLHPERDAAFGAQAGEHGERHENEIERLPSTVSSSSSAEVSTQYGSIRSRPGNNRNRLSSTYTHDTYLHRSETNRINEELERHPTALERITTHRTQHLGTVGSFAIDRKDKSQWPSFGGGKPFPPTLPKREEYVVEFDGHDDPMHPQNWSSNKKCAFQIA